MTKGHNKFVEGLKFDDGGTSQKEIAEEAIKKQLFHILSNPELKNGEVKEIEKVVEQIANDLGIQECRSQIKIYITQLFESDRYQYGIDSNGNIIATYSRLYMMQMKEDKTGCEAAEKKLQKFIQLVKKYVGNLEQQNVKINKDSIISQFDNEELRKNAGLIELAIESVTGEQMPMKSFDYIETYRDEL